MIRATPADRDAIMAFLMTRPTVAMFPITNLRDHGMEGGHPKAMRFWMAQDGGQITDDTCTCLRPNTETVLVSYLLLSVHTSCNRN